VDRYQSGLYSRSYASTYVRRRAHAHCRHSITQITSLQETESKRRIALSQQNARNARRRCGRDPYAEFISAVRANVISSEPGSTRGSKLNKRRICNSSTRFIRDISAEWRDYNGWYRSPSCPSRSPRRSLSSLQHPSAIESSNLAPPSTYSNTYALAVNSYPRDSCEIRRDEISAPGPSARPARISGSTLAPSPFLSLSLSHAERIYRRWSAPGRIVREETRRRSVDSVGT